MFVRSLSLAWGTLAALMLSGEGHARAENVEVRFSGHINRAILHADDGVAKKWFNVDNSSSSTRLRLNVDTTISSGLRAGAFVEVEYQSNPSNLVNFATPQVSAQLLERFIEIYVNGSWGIVRLGQGDGAAARSAEVDLSGTAMALYPNSVVVGGGFVFRTSAGALSGVPIRNVIGNQNFEMRYDRLRYSTPSFAGFWVDASWGNKERGIVETALRYGGTLGGVGQLAGAIGYSNERGLPGAIDDEVVGGSFSWVHTSGINFTYGAARRVLAGRDAQFRHFKPGFRWNRHAVAMDYAEGADQAALGDEAKMLGFAYVYSPVDWAEVYAVSTRHTLERPARGFQPIQFYMIGTRIRF